MHPFSSMRDELEKIAAGRLVPGLSLGGLAGLTAIEGAGAFNKKKSRNDRLKDGASAGFTGAILASEAIHHGADSLKNGGILRKGVNMFKGVAKHASNKGGPDVWEGEGGNHIEDIAKPKRVAEPPKRSSAMVHGKPVSGTPSGHWKRPASAAKVSPQIKVTGGLGPKMSGLNRVVESRPNFFSKALKGFVGNAKAVLKKVK